MPEPVVETGTRIRVLSVDDEEGIRGMLEAILSSEDIEFDSAQDGIEGFYKINQNHYDVVISDNSMPNMGGLEMLNAIKSANLNGKKPVTIILSGFVSQEDLIEYRKAGAFDYLQKPIDSQRIKETVRYAAKHKPQLFKKESLG